MFWTLSDKTYLYRRQVEEVLVSAKKYKPAVLQNESHPYLHEKDLRNYCAINKIAFQVKLLLISFICHENFSFGRWVHN